MNRIDRLHALLTHLQSKRRVTARELSQRFDLSLRTVYRDIRALEEAGVPLIGEAGVGYSIMEGYRLPPVLFTQEEASAVLLSAKLAQRFTDASVNKHLGDALFKIKAVLRNGDKELMEALDGSVRVSEPLRGAPDRGGHLLLLQKALAQKRVIRVSYSPPYKDKRETRDLEAIGLYHYSTGWHLIAWCRLRGAYRDFRVDRMENLRLLEETFDGAARISLTDYLKTYQPRELQEATVLFRKEVARLVVDQRYLHGFVSEESVPEGVRMHFAISCTDYFARWLLGFTSAVTIESPAPLKDRLRALVAEAANHVDS